MPSKYPAAYRAILRELRKSLSPSRSINPAIRAQFRSLIEAAASNSPSGILDINHTILFLKSQREHKRLLDRYNPLVDLNAQERIEATARRVGLNMPKLHKGEQA